MAKREEWEKKVTSWWDANDFEHCSQDASDYDLEDSFRFICELMKIVAVEKTNES